MNDKPIPLHWSELKAIANEPEAADKQTVAALASIIVDECGLDAAQQETVAEAVDWLLEFGYHDGIDITLDRNSGLVRKRIEQP